MIPVRNLYYLYAYAWELWPGGRPTQAGAEPFGELAPFLAKQFLGEVERLVRRGLDGGYEARREAVARPRGRILATPTLRPRITCEADERTADTSANRLLKAALELVRRHADLPRELRRHAAALAMRFAEIPARREGVILHRANAHYRLPVQLAAWLFDASLPTPSGDRHFREPLRDEKHMARLFEAFVRNFYRREQSLYPRVGVRRFAWQATGDVHLLPELRTDACLSNGRETLIVEAKFYRDALGDYYDARSLHAGHLHQLFAYLANWTEGDVRGLLLYPTTRDELNLNLTLNGYRVRVATVNLAAAWPAIHARMLSLLRAPT